MLRKEIHQENRISWNKATIAHNSHKKDQATFFRAGGSTLFPEEIELLQEINGKTLVHLQCNAGQDTLSLARLGATVRGVDISDTAIDFARQLSSGSAIPAEFTRADIFDWLEQTAKSTERYDIAYSSYGSIVWLSDLKEWATGIKNILHKGGRLVLLDFHPFVMVYDWDWSLAFPYFGNGVPNRDEDGVGDYVALSGKFLTPSGYLPGAMNFKNPHPAVEFQWSIEDILAAVLSAGLKLILYREYPYMNGARLLCSMRETAEGRMYPPPGFPALPLMYGLVAIKE